MDTSSSLKSATHQNYHNVTLVTYIYRKCNILPFNLIAICHASESYGNRFSLRKDKNNVLLESIRGRYSVSHQWHSS